MRHALPRAIDRRNGRGPGERIVDPAPHGSDARWRTANYARSDILPAGRPWPVAARDFYPRGSDVGRKQLRSWSFSTEAHSLREKGFAVLALMRRGRGRSEGINGEENFARGHDGSVTDFSAEIAERSPMSNSAIAYGRKLPSVRQGPVLLVEVE